LGLQGLTQKTRYHLKPAISFAWKNAGYRNSVGLKFNPFLIGTEIILVLKWSNGL